MTASWTGGDGTVCLAYADQRALLPGVSFEETKRFGDSIGRHLIASLHWTFTGLCKE